MDKAREEVAAVAGAIATFEVPPVPHDPGGRVGRAPKSLTTTGAIVSSPGYREFLVAKAAKVKAETQAKVDKISHKVMPSIHSCGK